MSTRKGTKKAISLADPEDEIIPRRSKRHSDARSLNPVPKNDDQSEPAIKKRKTTAVESEDGSETASKSLKKGSRKTTTTAKSPSAAPTKKSKSEGAADVEPEEAGDEDRSYWLMKAEPESRFENGVDVKFSIDDLASRTEPEPWDGIRAYAARNNLRAMKKGELAFFYHSNCKEPGIVGTMEIVQEHSPDLSAHDPKAPYYDANSKPSDPKWSVVHVKFRSKFAQQVGLKELREMGKPGEALENMQMLKQSRLSVSRVAPAEWDYLMEVVAERGGETVKAS
ncbi:DUF55-domain-containing protein [Xylariaceae sp. FL0255]|nr:DUF55-domain-containing protein [Xylariaceae sp. FL0255]